MSNRRGTKRIKLNKVDSNSVSSVSASASTINDQQYKVGDYVWIKKGSKKYIVLIFSIVRGVIYCVKVYDPSKDPNEGTIISKENADTFVTLTDIKQRFIGRKKPPYIQIKKKEIRKVITELATGVPGADSVCGVCGGYVNESDTGVKCIKPGCCTSFHDTCLTGKYKSIIGSVGQSVCPYCDKDFIPEWYKEQFTSPPDENGYTLDLDMLFETIKDSIFSNERKIGDEVMIKEPWHDKEEFMMTYKPREQLLIRAYLLQQLKEEMIRNSQVKTEVVTSSPPNEITIPTQAEQSTISEMGRNNDESTTMEEEHTNESKPPTEEEDEDEDADLMEEEEDKDADSMEEDNEHTNESKPPTEEEEEEEDAEPMEEDVEPYVMTQNDLGKGVTSYDIKLKPRGKIELTVGDDEMFIKSLDASELVYFRSDGILEYIKLSFGKAQRISGEKRVEVCNVGPSKASVTILVNKNV